MRVSEGRLNTILKYEIKRTWNIEELNIEVVEIVPIIVGARGIIKKGLVEHLKRIPIQISTIELSKIVIKKRISILRMTLGFRNTNLKVRSSYSTRYRSRMQRNGNFPEESPFLYKECPNNQNSDESDDEDAELELYQIQ
ncbi:hypothetical protein Anas_14055, partial [Armadillidium nasatum]